jgi:hypothetical protein
LDFSAKFPCDEVKPWADCHLVFDSLHANLVGAAKTQIRDFLAADQTVCPSGLAQMKPAAAALAPAAAELAVSVAGRVRPYLIAPTGAKSGVNPATGLLESGIPGAQVALDAQNGAIALTSPTVGAYQMLIGGAANESVVVTLSYLTAAQPIEKKVRLFHHGGTTTLSFQLTGVAGEPLTIDGLPAPPAQARAEAVQSVTRIAWQASPTVGVSGYRVYGRRADEPFLSLLGTVNGLFYDTGAPWAGQGAAPLSIFAVSALLPDGRESVLSDLIENNDRDQDGLSDSEEAELGTNPDRSDSDGDGLADSMEVRLGTNPNLADTDADGVPDATDAFALEPGESVDTDSDGIGNNADTDDDNDGRGDTADNCQLVANPDQADDDRDGIGNACDPTPAPCWECLPNRGGWRAIMP